MLSAIVQNLRLMTAANAVGMLLTRSLLCAPTPCRTRYLTPSQKHLSNHIRVTAGADPRLFCLSSLYSQWKEESHESCLEVMWQQP